MSEERKLITCSKCGNKLGVSKSHSFDVKKMDSGKPAHSIVDVEHTGGGRMNITCGSCGLAFSVTEKVLPMSYEVAPVDKNLQ